MNLPYKLQFFRYFVSAEDVPSIDFLYNYESLVMAIYRSLARSSGRFGMNKRRLSYQQREISATNFSSSARYSNRVGKHILSNSISRRAHCTFHTSLTPELCRENKLTRKVKIRKTPKYKRQRHRQSSQ